MPKFQLRSISASLAGVALAASVGWSSNLAMGQLPIPEVESLQTENRGGVPSSRPPASPPAGPSAPSASPLPPPAYRASTSTPAETPTPTVQSSSAANVQPGEQVFQVVSPHSKINIRALDTRVLELGNRIKVVDGFDQEKITVKALSPHRVRLHAENPGVTTLKLIDEFDNTYIIDVFVEPDTRELEAYLQRLFPESAIDVVGIRDGVVLRGWVTEPAQIPQIMAIAEQFYEIVHPQLNVAGPSQVQLHVKVMEVQRSKLRELGFNFLMTGQQYYVQQGVGALAPLQSLSPTGYLPFGGPPRPSVLPASLTNSDMQFAITGNNNIFQDFLKALQTESLAKILAEPILVTTSGRPATVHSGGEFPVLVPQSFGNLSIQWREFGVRLEAVPIVLGQGRLRLDLAPEVSERDFSNSVSINGLVVPGITSRSVNTQVEMRFGETLMIGGLISSRNLGTTQGIPFLADLPWIGIAFSKKSYTVGETELIILVTPQMVSPMTPHQVPAGGPGASTTVPVDRELYGDGVLEVPRYGPDCPDCQPDPGYIIPADSPMAPGVGGELMPQPQPTLPAVGAKGKSKTDPDSASNLSLATPGQRTTVVNPFHSASRQIPSTTTKEPAVAARSNATGIQQASASTDGKKGTETKAKSAIFETRSLPGLIQPKPKSEEKQKTAE